ncbi:MAG: DUF1697 domain-containing protein [Betaproteobacteria bacterium]
MAADKKMTTWIALFRGINVGGNNLMPMKALAALLENAGGSGVKTYIQSGNAVFRHAESDAAKLAKRIEAAVEKEFGFAPRLMLLTQRELVHAAKSNPYPQADAVPTSLHLAFLAAQPREPKLDALDALKADTEAFTLGKGIFYLYTPAGFGKSKLGERYEKLLGVSATARNWNTVTKLLEMAQQAGDE